MKKVFFYSIVCLALVFSSCGQNKTESDFKSDSIARADSMKVAQIKAELEKEVRDSLDWVNFATSDLKCFCVHGHVKSIKQVQYTPEGYTFEEKMTFDEEGKLTSHIYNNQRMVIHRDSKGRIESEIEPGEGYAGTNEITYEYDASGNPTDVSDGNEHGGVNNKYGKNGFFTTGGGMYMDISGEREWESTYSYNSLDEYGNWISCTINRRERDQSEYEDEEGNCPDIEQIPYKKAPSHKMSRTITYYQR